jgi:hypothetical protein
MHLPIPNINYLERFDYAVKVKLGKVYSKEFKEFYAWCDQHLGVHYKDWFIINAGKDIYTLRCRNDKWATFLALSWFDVIE